MASSLFLASCGSTKVEETKEPAKEPEAVVEEKSEPVKTSSQDYSESNKKLLEEVEKARLNAIKAGADVYWKKAKVFYGSYEEVARAMLKEAEKARANAIEAGADSYFPEEFASSDNKKSTIESEFASNPKVDYSDRLSELIVEYEALEENARNRSKEIFDSNTILLAEVENTRADAVKAGAETYWKNTTLVYATPNGKENVSFSNTEEKRNSVKESFAESPKKDYSSDLKDLIEKYRLLRKASETQALIDKMETTRETAIDAGAEYYFESALAKADVKRDAVKSEFDSEPKGDYNVRLNALIAEYEAMGGNAQAAVKNIPARNKSLFASVEKAREKAVNAGAEYYLNNAKVSFVSNLGKGESEYISLTNTDERKDAAAQTMKDEPTVDQTKVLRDLISRYETLEKATYTQMKFSKAEEARADAIDAKADTYVPDMLATADTHRDEIRVEFDKNSTGDYADNLNSLISEYKAAEAKARDLQEREVLSKEGSYISFPGTDVKSDIVQESFGDLSSTDYSEQLNDLIERYKVLEKASYTQAMLDNVENARTKAVAAGAEAYFPEILSSFDSRRDATKVNFKSNPRGNYTRVLSELVVKYESLERASQARILKNKADAMDPADISETAMKNADSELAKYVSLSSAADGKSLSAQADKAYASYDEVVKAGYAVMVVRERKAAVDAKKKAESEKAQVNKFTKDAYKAATEVYKKADVNFKLKKNEDAYNEYKVAKESYLEQYKTVKKAKGEAVDAQEKSQKSKRDAESFAAAADATNPLTEKVAGIEDEETTLLKKDTFANPEDSVINVDSAEVDQIAADALAEQAKLEAQAAQAAALEKAASEKAAAEAKAAAEVRAAEAKAAAEMRAAEAKAKAEAEKAKASTIDAK